MPRKIFIQNPENPYHISARSNNRDWFALPMDEVWFIFGRFLYLLHHAYGVEIYAFVLMNNHFHLLARFPMGNLIKAMQYFMRETSRCIAFESERINHVYGGRFFRCEIGSFHYFTHTYKYVYRNPVEARLCNFAEEYPYSTLNGLIGKTPLLIPMQPDTLLFENGGVEQTLTWLNRRPPQEEKEMIRKALRKNEFKLAKKRSTEKPHPLEWMQF